jgi:hypothetical protein
LIHDFAIALSKCVVIICFVIARGADKWHTQLRGSKETEIASGSTGISLQFITHSHPNSEPFHIYSIFSKHLFVIFSSLALFLHSTSSNPILIRISLKTQGGVCEFRVRVSLLHYFNLRGRRALRWIPIRIISVAIGFKEHVRFS